MNQRALIAHGIVGLLALAAVNAAAAPESKSDLVKVVVIEKLVRFIEWPGTRPTHFTLCVAQDHPQWSNLRAYYDHSTILDLPVLLRPLRKGDNLSPCRAVLLNPADAGEHARLLAISAREHVLLIAEGADMARAGVHIGFYFDMNKMRLEINRKAMEASGLKASYKLLEVAKIVE